MQMNHERLQAIIDAHQAETEALEFKRQLPDASERERRKLCKSVSAQANGAGGHIIFGLADPGTVEPAPPMERWGERTELMLRQVLDGGIEPRVPGLSFVAIDVGEVQYVVLHVPKSLIAPHMVKLGGSQEFYVRSGPRSVPMDIAQIRQSVLAQHSLRERLRIFVDQRARAIRDGVDFNLRLVAGPMFVLHIVPIAAWDGSSLIDPVAARKFAPLAVPLFSGGAASHVRLNADGLLSWDTSSGGVAYYTLVFREGVIESFASLVPFTANGVFSGIDRIEGEVVSTVLRSVKLLDSLGVPSVPIVVSAHLLHVHDLVVAQGAGLRGNAANRRIDRDHTRLPDVLIETAPSGLRDCARALRPLLDAIYQAGGHDGSPLFDGDGMPFEQVWGQR